jgi:hypothetical protein
MNKKTTFILATITTFGFFCIGSHELHARVRTAKPAESDKQLEIKKELEKECGTMTDADQARQKEFIQCLSELYYRTDMPMAYEYVRSASDRYPRRKKAIMDQINQNASRFCASCGKNELPK